MSRLPGALGGKGYVLTVCVGKGSRLPMALLEEGDVHGPNQVETQVTKLFPTLPGLEIPSKNSHKLLHISSHTHFTCHNTEQ